MSLYRNSQLGMPTNRQRQKLATVQSFFARHRMPLVFKRGEIDQAITVTEKYEITLEDLKAAKEIADPKEQWIFMGGKSLGQRIEVFSQIRKCDIELLLTQEPPVPIDIVSWLG